MRAPNHGEWYAGDYILCSPQTYACLVSALDDANEADRLEEWEDRRQTDIKSRVSPDQEK